MGTGDRRPEDGDWGLGTRDLGTGDQGPEDWTRGWGLGTRGWTRCKNLVLRNSSVKFHNGFWCLFVVLNCMNCSLDTHKIKRQQGGYFSMHGMGAPYLTVAEISTQQPALAT